MSGENFKFLVSLFVDLWQKEENEFHKKRVYTKFYRFRSIFPQFFLIIRKTLEDREILTGQNTICMIFVTGNRGCCFFFFF